MHSSSTCIAQRIWFLLCLVVKNLKKVFYFSNLVHNKAKNLVSDQVLEPHAERAYLQYELQKQADEIIQHGAFGLIVIL